jgi:hypothetical protein
MHEQAMAWLKHRFADRTLGTVVEIGSYNHNGSAREALEHNSMSWTGIDIISGPNVDYVCNIMDTDELDDFQSSLDMPYFDTVVSTEVLEHVTAKEMIEAMLQLVDPDFHSKQFIITCANAKRKPHSADGGELKPNEHYCGLNAGEVIALFDTAIQRDMSFVNSYVEYHAYHNPESHDTYVHVVIGYDTSLAKYFLSKGTYYDYVRQYNS